ncbi:hypothetical protein DOY81_007068 [Sarcophaga bullata]|nr:hypothetical protein DOY81_007068 [Sarcophaga bullata]
MSMPIDIFAALVNHIAKQLRRIKFLLKGNVGRYINEILGPNIIHKFNVDDTHGKQSFKQFKTLYTACIDAFAVFSDEPDIALRKAFQLQKKKLLKPTAWKD